MSGEHWNRRDVIRGVVGGLVAASVARDANAVATDHKDRVPELIVRGGSPLNAETPVEMFDTYLTPVARLFIRSHFGPPGQGAASSLEVGGMVKAPRQWTSIELRRLPSVTMTAVLQCSGNGRGLFSPRVPG